MSTIINFDIKDIEIMINNLINQLINYRPRYSQSQRPWDHIIFKVDELLVDKIYKIESSFIYIDKNNIEYVKPYARVKYDYASLTDNDIKEREILNTKNMFLTSILQILSLGINDLSFNNILFGDVKCEVIGDYKFDIYKQYTVNQLIWQSYSTDLKKSWSSEISSKWLI